MRSHTTTSSHPATIRPRPAPRARATSASPWRCRGGRDPGRQQRHGERRRGAPRAPRRGAPRRAPAGRRAPRPPGRRAPPRPRAARAGPSRPRAAAPPATRPARHGTTSTRKRPKMSPTRGGLAPGPVCHPTWPSGATKRHPERGRQHHRAGDDRHGAGGRRVRACRRGARGSGAAAARGPPPGREHGRHRRAPRRRAPAVGHHERREQHGREGAERPDRDRASGHVAGPGGEQQDHRQQRDRPRHRQDVGVEVGEDQAPERELVDGVRDDPRRRPEGSRSRQRAVLQPRPGPGEVAAREAQEHGGHAHPQAAAERRPGGQQSDGEQAGGQADTEVEHHGRARSPSALPSPATRKCPK